MGKRFGRNQKRRMRQQVNSLELRNAQLEYSHTLDRHLLADMSGKLEEARCFIAEIKEVVGESCVIAGSPELMKVSNTPVRLPIGSSLGVNEGLIFSPEFSDAAMLSAVLNALSVSAVRSVVAGQLHVLAELAGKQVRLCLSDGAIRNMPRNVLESRIAKDMARQLVIELRGK